jgi:hypothetical protein
LFASRGETIARKKKKCQLRFFCFVEVGGFFVKSRAKKPNLRRRYYAESFIQCRVNTPTG